METTLVWFREDLRLADHPALHAAAQRGAVVPVYIWSPDEEGEWAPGGASRVWLDGSLRALDASLRRSGSRLVVRRGHALDTLRSVARECGATSVYWNRRYTPASVERDKAIKSALTADGLRVDSHKAALLFEPWEIATRQDGPYRIFTPFWKACLARGSPDDPLPAPARIDAPSQWPDSDDINALSLRPDTGWDAGIRANWDPGEAAAQERLRDFLEESARDYAPKRDEPATDETSRLSPHLHFGEISPRSIWHATHQAHPRGKSAGTFLRELGWREFAHHVLFHFPDTTTKPMRPEFAAFPWEDDATGLRAWQRGRTGYPIVDAGMRQLWRTGWMHNRARMIVASFLVKDLRIHWLEGARWFWDTLVDADLANNTLGWQWAAGSGADAAPYFRVFNPVLQGEKFDTGGAYVREWVPELADLPAKWIHQPWRAPAGVLKDAGITLGDTYPAPMVDHALARTLALEAFAGIRSS